MKSTVFAYVSIHLHFRRNKSYYLKRNHRKLDKFDEVCRNISGTIKHCIDIQVKKMK